MSPSRIGPHTPRGTYQRMRYIGSNTKLKGKEALVAPYFECKVVAQFCDLTTGLGFGWHEFNKKDFELCTLG